jgi:hypothetical protein
VVGAALKDNSDHLEKGVLTGVFDILLKEE